MKPFARTQPSLLTVAARGLAAATVIAATAATAQPAVPQQALERVLDGREIGTTHKLPTAGGLIAVEAGGKLYILSANGRFLFDGTLRDLWHGGQTLGTMTDIERYALRVDLDALGLDFSRLVTVSLGDGPRDITIFVSPDCPACDRALDTLASMRGQYTARVVVVPGAGDAAAVRRINCAEDPGARRALLLGESNPNTEQASSAPCAGSRARLLATQMAARVIGVNRVPFVIAPNGRVSRGLPTDTTLAGFLAGTEGHP